MHIFDKHIKIGCQLHSTEEWEVADDTQIATMASGALEFWRKHKDRILYLAKAHQQSE